MPKKNFQKINPIEILQTSSLASHITSTTSTEPERAGLGDRPSVSGEGAAGAAGDTDLADVVRPRGLRKGPAGARCGRRPWLHEAPGALPGSLSRVRPGASQLPCHHSAGPVETPLSLVTKPHEQISLGRERWVCLWGERPAAPNGVPCARQQSEAVRPCGGR